MPWTSRKLDRIWETVNFRFWKTSCTAQWYPGEGKWTSSPVLQLTVRWVSSMQIKEAKPKEHQVVSLILEQRVQSSWENLQGRVPGTRLVCKEEDYASEIYRGHLFTFGLWTHLDISVRRMRAGRGSRERNEWGNHWRTLRAGNVLCLWQTERRSPTTWDIA